jgi:hypothetical protein
MGLPGHSHRLSIGGRFRAASKNGISANQLHRALGVTLKTTRFMGHRIRLAMTDGQGDMLGGEGTSGIVEADATYFGKTTGFGKGGHSSKKQKIVALVERKGRVRAFHVPTVTVDTLKPLLESLIAPSARLMTDSAPFYRKAGKSFASHETVNHNDHEYVRDDVTTNSVEGFFGVLKLGIRGVYQHVSPRAVPNRMYGIRFGFPRRAGASHSHVPYIRMKTALSI